MTLLAEVLVRSLVMTVVIVIVGLSLQIALYAESLQLHWLTVHWFKTTLPWIVAIGLTISLMVGVVTETVRLIGGPLLASIVLGTYHRPVREQLIVMFLDLADSTPLAEKLGELRVHDLITRFFFNIDEPINDHGGSVLSYVGDEVIVTWPVTDDPARNARCLVCFFAIDNKISGLSTEYQEEFDTIPRFRAGLHCGPVIVSECGGFKRQLAYFGDTMNVSARLCEYCKICGCNLIVSGDVLSQVTIPQNLQVSVGRSIALRGRNSLLEVHEAHQIADRFARRLCRNRQKPYRLRWAQAERKSEMGSKPEELKLSKCLPLDIRQCYQMPSPTRLHIVEWHQCLIDRYGQAVSGRGLLVFTDSQNRPHTPPVPPPGSPRAGRSVADA